MKKTLTFKKAEPLIEKTQRFFIINQITKNKVDAYTIRGEIQVVDDKYQFSSFPIAHFNSEELHEIADKIEELNFLYKKKTKMRDI